MYLTFRGNGDADATDRHPAINPAGLAATSGSWLTLEIMLNSELACRILITVEDLPILRVKWDESPETEERVTGVMDLLPVFRTCRRSIIGRDMAGMSREGSRT
jgi:hypothetical protein